jgi:hypothetical protein
MRRVIKLIRMKVRMLQEAAQERESQVGKRAAARVFYLGDLCMDFWAPDRALTKAPDQDYSPALGWC